MTKRKAVVSRKPAKKRAPGKTVKSPIKRQNGRRTVKDKIAIAEKVVELYVTGEYSIDSCCEKAGVNYEAFKGWAAASIDSFEELDDAQKVLVKRRGFVPEVHAIFKKAKQLNVIGFKAILKNKSREALIKKVSGFEYEEVTTEVKTDADGNAKPVSIKKTMKYYPPDTVATIFALKNIDSDNFSDTKKIDATITPKSDLSHMTIAELDREEKRIKSVMAQTRMEMLDAGKK